MADEQGGSSYLAIGFIGDVDVVSIADESGHGVDFDTTNRGGYGVALVEAAVGTWLMEAVVDGQEVDVLVALGETAVVQQDDG